MNRRDLFKSAALAGALAQARGAPAPLANDRIGIGVVGCGGMGRMDLADFQKQPEAEIVALCDVYQTNLQEALQLTDGKARTYSDSANSWTTVESTRWSSPPRIIGIRSSPSPPAMRARMSTWKSPYPMWCAKAA